MTGLYEVEIEPEVRSWLASLSDRDLAGSTSLSACSPSTLRTSASPTAEVTRALGAQMICETQHSQAHDIFDREVD